MREFIHLPRRLGMSVGAAGAALLADMATDAVFRRAFVRGMQRPVRAPARRHRARPHKLKSIRGERLLWWP